ncbi:putative UDP-N-acetylglucosamine--peptide N-acetylglucosaminyltransferase SEC [Schistosoma japonicum]|uniref:Putative UDP-N-acetylglucosamine--peptide N-acetylglucosaminyltransferase SEC n=1 Tax=Schistosoma japonicum TaxID=6182 RepID=A0A4Z2D2F3_SCHJA|nr:putative UDP-N-acetylglucosamine--peptide N-acetylglucosaminyltransferase SEC [Schistosoma japonicum]
MEISNEKKIKVIDWTKEVRKIPKNIEPVLEFFGSNKHQQSISYKLITNEIESLTYYISRNSPKRTGFDLCRRGALNRKIGRLQDAKTDLLKSIEIEPKLSSAYWNIHFLFLLEGRINEALNTLEQCTECAIMSNSLHNFTTICSTTDNNKNNCSDLKNVNMKSYQFYQNLLHSKAFIYSLLNDTKMEIEMWTQLINCNPTFELAYDKRANLYQKLKMFDYANDDFMKILCLNPKSSNARFQHGLYTFYSDNWKTAIYDFQEVLSNNPSHFKARYYLARCLLKLSKYSIALAELTACLYFQPNYYKALYTRGCLLTKVCPLQSLRDLSMCICVGNKKYQTMAFVQRGLVFYQSRKYTMAIHDFQSALKNGYFQLPDVYRLLGLAYIQLNLSTRAIQTYTEGIKCQTIPDVKLLLCRAEAYYYSNEYGKAIADAQRVIHLSPHVKEYYLLLGNYFYKLLNTQLVQRCVQHYSSLAEIQNQKQVKQLALAYYYLNKYKEAELILLADTKHQFELDHMLLLGLILHKQQRTMNSIQLLVNGLKKFSSKKLSEKAPLYDHLGQYYMKIGNYFSAIDAFTDFIQIDSECPHVYLNRAQSACQLMNSQFQVKSKNSPNNLLIHFDDDNVLNDISRALVLINSSKSPIPQITFSGPIKYVDLVDQCLLTRIMYFGMNQRYTKAILNCNEAVHRRPEWTRIWIYSGVFKYILKTYDFSEADFNMAIEKDQRSSLAYYSRGLCRQLCNKWNEAINIAQDL